MAQRVTLQGADEFILLMNELPETMYTQTHEILKDAVFNAHRNITAYRGGLVNRTGSLRRSLRTKVSGNTLATLKGEVWTNSKYAPIQETGGTIVAKNAYRRVAGGPYLNIPLSDNKTARGVMRETARQVFDDGGYVFKARSGKHFVASSTGQLMFILVKQVEIPARLNMLKSGEDEIPTLLSRLRQLDLE